MTTWELKLLGHMAAAIEERPEWIAVSSFRRILRELGVFRPEAQNAILEAGRDLELWQFSGWSEAARYIPIEDMATETIHDKAGWCFSRVALRFGPRGQWRGRWRFPSIRRAAEWRALNEAVTFA